MCMFIINIKIILKITRCLDRSECCNFNVLLKVVNSQTMRSHFYLYLLVFKIINIVDLVSTPTFLFCLFTILNIVLLIITQVYEVY